MELAEAKETIIRFARANHSLDITVQELRREVSRLEQALKLKRTAAHFLGLREYNAIGVIV